MRAATAFKHAANVGRERPRGDRVPYRVVVPGAELQMLVLTAAASGCVGVDLDTGAFVYASHPPGASIPEPFDIVSAEIGGTVEPPDAARPEALELAEPPEPLGQMSLKRAERLLAPLHHPPQLPLLGLHGNPVPYWTLSGDRPSLALVTLRSDARLRWGPYGPECHFSWQGQPHELPMVDHRLIRAIELHGLFRPSRADVERLLGYRPRRLLVMLTPPEHGYCYRAVGALLPTGR